MSARKQLKLTIYLKTIVNEGFQMTAHRGMFCKIKSHKDVAKSQQIRLITELETALATQIPTH